MTDCRSASSSEIGMNRLPMPMNSRRWLKYMRVDAARICPEARRRASRSGAAGRHVARDAASTTRATITAKREQHDPRLSQRMRSGPASRGRSRRRRTSSCWCRARRPRARRRCGRASSLDQRTGSVHCVFRFGPVGPLKKAGCSSPQRPSNAIHGNARRAAAGSLGIVLTSGRTSGRRLARVVAADALRAGGAEEERRGVEAGVRACGRVEDRMRAVDELELVVAPLRALGAFVLAEADARRRAGEGVASARRVEVELDHLPVALVQVVPVVEGVEEPVLQRELPRGVRLAWRRARRRRARSPRSRAAPSARSRSPDRGRRRGSRGGSRRGRPRAPRRWARS